MQARPMYTKSASPALPSMSPIDLAAHRRHSAQRSHLGQVRQPFDNSPPLPATEDVLVFSDLAMSQPPYAQSPIALSFSVRNMSSSHVQEYLQVYVRLSDGPTFGEDRLIAWEHLDLQPMEMASVAVGIDESLLSQPRGQGRNREISSHVWLLIKTLGQTRHAQMVYTANEALCEFPDLAVTGVR